MTVNNNITAANGMFTITNAGGVSQPVDLGTLLMMLNLDRTKNLDNQIADLLTVIQQRNDQIKALTDFMAECRSRKAQNQDGSAQFTFGSKEAALWNELVGGTWSTTTSKDDAKVNAAWDANINAIQGKIDMLNNDSQMDNIKLQNLLEKRGNAFEQASKVMDTNNQSLSAVIRNL